MKTEAEKQKARRLTRIAQYEKYIEQRGGRCEICDRSFIREVYELHHIDPSSKEVAIRASNFTFGGRCHMEAEKTALLCANCHRAEHKALREGYSLLPENYTTPSGHRVVIPNSPTSEEET